MHRYFSHRCFSTSRWFNILMAIYACFSKQRGPMWWASTHRRHHKHCETKYDPHCPGVQGWLYSHYGWLVNRDNFYIRLPLVRDWLNSNPEILLFDLYFPSVAAQLLGRFCNWLFPFLETYVWHGKLTEGMVMHASNFAVPVAMHLVFCTNSLCHTWEQPAHMEDVAPGVHWSVVNGGQNHLDPHWCQPQLA